MTTIYTVYRGGSALRAHLRRRRELRRKGIIR